MTIKTYLALKTFIHEAYSCRLAQHVYTAPAHNIFHVSDMSKDNGNSAKDITVATVAVTVAATTASPLGQGTAASSLHPGLITAVNQSIALAFNQVVQNQMILQNQIAAMSLAQPPLAQAPAHQYIVPPIPHVAFPMQQPFQRHMQQQQYHQTNGFGRGQQGQFQGGRGGQAAAVMDVAVVVVDASVVLLLRPRLCQKLPRTNGPVPRP
jgi:hypothetical protein